jgi:SecD/SecF fusion protein
MQNKGAIRILAIALAIVCVYQLSFTFITRKVERDADRSSGGDALARSEYIDSISGEIVYNILVRKYTYKECKEREMNLGLDLKGGMNVTLEISMVDMLRSLSNYNTDSTFIKAISLAREYQKDSQEDFITLFGRAFEDIDPNGKLAALFATRELRGTIDYNSTNEEVLRVIRAETEGAMDNAFNVLRNRIDRYGVVQPNIQRLETQGRILVELPGIKEPERVRKLLQGTASLEFWETYDNSEIFPYLQDANDRIREIQAAEKNLQSAEENAQMTAEGASQGESALPDLPGDIAQVETSRTDTAREEISLLDQLQADSLAGDTTAQTLEGFVKENPLLGILQPNVTRNGQFVPGAGVGFAHIKDTGKVMQYLKLPQIRAMLPRDVKFNWDMKPFDEAGSYYVLYALKVTGRDGRPPLTGEVVTNSTVDFDQNRSTATVVMGMNAEGSQVWQRLTRENVGKAIAVVLDNYVASAPTVSEEIPNGRSTISGNFTYNEAEDLANVLKSGKLPAPATIVQEAIVGPTLGKEAIRGGLNSFIIAFIIVMAYMMFYYSRSAGLIANIGLVANMFFLMGVLASLGAVLTLPGIAGIVLTIGMSVDANVLIYERVREELAAGKGIKQAIADGYKGALSAIIDSNVTTIIVGVVLLVSGSSGPIKGFATTLVIGICTSLFSALLITRLIYEMLLTKNTVLTFATRITQGAFKNIHFKFIENRKIFYAISTCLMVIFIISLVVRGLSMGVDFKGGRTFVVRFDQPVNTEEIAASLENVFGGSPQVITFGAENQIRITTDYKIDDDNAEAAEETERLLYQGLDPFLGDDVDFNSFMVNNRQSSEKVGPTVADDIKIQSVWAIFFSLIGIFLYVFIRFRNWQFGLGGIVALVHDAMMTIGIFSLLWGIMPFSMEIDQAFIAAILTILGFSINDTVVIFDRVREYVGLYRKRDKTEIINLAINATISRTINTSLTVLFTLIVIFIFGGESIRGFTFALIIGVTTGTYSTVFIATALVYDTTKAGADWMKFGKRSVKQ